MIRPELISAEPYEFYPLVDHVSLHPEKGHLGINAIVSDLGRSRGLIREYKPSPKVLQAAYAECGYLWEDALEEQLKRRQKIRAKKNSSYISKQLMKLTPRTQLKVCANQTHMIPDAVWFSGDKAVIVDEYKWTMTQPVADPSNLLREKWAWGVVTHCYANHFDAELVRFIVCWIGYKPMPMEYVFRLSQQDRVEMFEMVQQHRKLMQKKMRGRA